MSIYSNRLQPALQNLLQHVDRFFHPRLSCMTHIPVDVFGRRKSLVKPVTWQKTCNYIELFGSSTPRLSCTTMHISADVQRITLNASCMTISVEEPNNSIYSAASLALRVIFSVLWLCFLYGFFTEPFNYDDDHNKANALSTSCCLLLSHAHLKFNCLVQV